MKHPDLKEQGALYSASCEKEILGLEYFQQ